MRLSVIGRRDRLPAGLASAIARAEALTAGRPRLHLRIAIDYSARDAILARGALRPARRATTRESFARLLGEAARRGPRPTWIS